MVFRIAVARSALAPMLLARSAPSTSRLLSSSALRRADDHAAPVLQGDGAAPGETPSSLQQATGLERFEMLGKMQGIDVFDMKPLDASRTGTIKNPIVVQSMVSPKKGLAGS